MFATSHLPSLPDRHRSTLKLVVFRDLYPFDLLASAGLTCFQCPEGGSAEECNVQHQCAEDEVKAVASCSSSPSFSSSWGSFRFVLFLSLFVVSPRAHFLVVGMLRFMSDINQPSLPTPVYSVLVSVFVFVAVSTVLHSINFPYSFPFSSYSFCLISLPYWSFQPYISLWKSPSALI